MNFSNYKLFSETHTGPDYMVCFNIHKPGGHTINTWVAGCSSKTNLSRKEVMCTKRHMLTVSFLHNLTTNYYFINMTAWISYFGALLTKQLAARRCPLEMGWLSRILLEVERPLNELQIFGKWSISCITCTTGHQVLVSVTLNHYYIVYVVSNKLNLTIKLC